MSNLRIVFLDPGKGVLLAAAISCAEHSSCDVVFQELFVYHVHYRWDDGFDVFLTLDQGNDII